MFSRLIKFCALILLTLYACNKGKTKHENKTITDMYKNMVFIKEGEFIMGDVNGLGTENEKPLHKVRLKSFYLNRHEVIVKEFSQFVEETKYITDAEKVDSSLAFFKGKWGKHKGVNWRYDATGTLRAAKECNHPVVHVSWNDANAFCLWLSKKTDKKFRLPTEAEWEFAARNRGVEIVYSWGNGEPKGKNGSNVADESLLKQASDVKGWSNYNDGFAYTAPVGCFNPNGLGLFDMTGNVWEWCSDWFDPNYYSTSPKENPYGPSTGTVKSFRGGCWFSDQDYARITFHNFGNFPDQSYGDFGFRVAMNP